MIDSTMTVVTAHDLQGRTLGSLMNWAAHPTLMPEGNTLISSDYTGAYCRHMRESLGGEHLFVNGAIGASVQALAPEDGWLKWTLGTATWTDVDQMGRLLADDAIALMAEGTPVEDPGIRLLETGEVHAIMENAFFSLFGQMGLIPRTVPSAGEYATTYATTFAIGPLTFGTMPGEFVPNYSFRMREIMGGDAQVIIGLGMDWIGYAITPEQYANPSYLYEKFFCPGGTVGEELMLFYEGIWGSR